MLIFPFFLKLTRLYFALKIEAAQPNNSFSYFVSLTRHVAVSISLQSRETLYSVHCTYERCEMYLVFLLSRVIHFLSAVRIGRYFVAFISLESLKGTFAHEFFILDVNYMNILQDNLKFETH